MLKNLQHWFLSLDDDQVLLGFLGILILSFALYAVAGGISLMRRVKANMHQKVLLSLLYITILLFCLVFLNIIWITIFLAATLGTYQASRWIDRHHQPVKVKMPGLLKASVLAGIVPAVLAPGLWPLLDLLAGDSLGFRQLMEYRGLQTFILHLASYGRVVFAMALVVLLVLGGLICSVIMVFPWLLLMELTGRIGFGGAVIGTTIAGSLLFYFFLIYVLGAFSLQNELPLALYIGLQAAVCTALAGYLYRNLSREGINRFLGGLALITATISICWSFVSIRMTLAS